jgi:hypothetical protein
MGFPGASFFAWLRWRRHVSCLCRAVGMRHVFSTSSTIGGIHCAHDIIGERLTMNGIAPARAALRGAMEGEDIGV